MKKYFSFLIAALLVASSAMSQSTSPRFATTKNGDNTGRVLTYGYVNLTDAAGADSVVLNPRFYQSYYQIVLLDSFTLKQPTLTSSYAGDHITIICTAASGTPFLKFSGSNWVTTGKATLSTNLRAVIDLIFDGSKWVEQNRVVQ